MAITAAEATQRLLNNPSAYQSEDALRALVNEISIEASGKTTLLYSGPLGVDPVGNAISSGEAVQKLINGGANVRVLDKTEVAKFLTSTGQDTNVTLRNHLTQVFGSNPLERGTTANDLAGIQRGSFATTSLFSSFTTTIRAHLFVSFTFLVLVATAPALQANELAKRRIEVQCGAYAVAITCGRDETPKSEDPRECNRNTLTFTGADGKTVVVKDPPVIKKFVDDKRPVMLQGTTPGEILCMTGKDGRRYVSIQYSRGPGSFTNEIFYDWFEPDGRRLTSLGIPLAREFKDPSEGVSWRQLPKPIAIDGE